MLADLLKGVGTAATGPYAFVAYIAVIVAWAYVTTAQAKIKHDIAVLDRIPTKERLDYVKQNTKRNRDPGSVPHNTLKIGGVP
jgi:hypothetical protein